MPTYTITMEDQHIVADSELAKRKGSSVGVFANSITGVEGQVTVPAAGALIGYFANWTLRSENGESYLFKGNLSYINEAAWNAEEMVKQVSVDIGKGKTYILDGAAETTLNGRLLTMKGVTLCPAGQ
jgi:hypothetical protein